MKGVQYLMRRREELLDQWFDTPRTQRLDLVIEWIRLHEDLEVIHALGEAEDISSTNQDELIPARRGT